MKRFYLSSMALLSAFLLGFYGSADAQSYSFSYTGGVQTLTIPAGVFSITVDAAGAQGGNGCSPGGLGGRMEATLSVNPGDVLRVLVGGQGQSETGTDLGGYNGGGQGVGLGGGGGGESDIRSNGAAYSNVILVAGAGGGGAYYDCGTCDAGGVGGGTTGGNGYAFCNNTSEQYYYGSGGGQTSSSDGATDGGLPGTQGQGGNAYLSGYYDGVGGGGAGYWGGGGGYYYGGGGGGSSYPAATGAEPTGTMVYTITANAQGYKTGNGYVNIGLICTPPTSGVITGPTSMCLPTTGFAAIPLTYTGTTGGNWYSLSPGVATISNTGVAASVAVGSTIISYALVYSCGTVTTTYPIAVNPTPSPLYTSSGPFSLCAGSTLTVNNGSAAYDLGGTWSSSNYVADTVAVTSSSTATVTGRAAGSPILTYTELDGCTTTATVTVLASPFAISGTPSVCVGSTTTLSDASPGGVWSSVFGALGSVSSTGVVGGLSPGAAQIKYTLPNTCFATLPVTVNAVPLNTSPTYLVSATATGYCSGGAGVPIKLNSSQVNVNYQLIYNGVSNVGAPVTGTSGSLIFGNQTAGGNYTVRGTSTITGCSSMMPGVGTFSVSPLPILHQLTATNGGAYCAGSGGVDLLLDSTQLGYGYQLYETGGTVVGSAIYNFSDPTDAGIDFGSFDGLFAAGTYYLVAYNISTGCQDTMVNKPTVVMNNVPGVKNVTVENGGNYCAGSAGVHVGLDYSDVGIDYELWLNGTAIVDSTSGTNSALDFGYQDVNGGSYTVMALNLLTGCSSAMTGSATLNQEAPPTAYPMSVGGQRCYGGDPIDISLVGSDGTVNYQLYRNDTLVGTVVPGTGSGTLDMGSWYAGGNYTIVGTDQFTNCVNTMSGSANITVFNLPAVENVTGGGDYCYGNPAGRVVGLSASQSGIDYQLYLGLSMQADMTSTGGAFNFAGQVLPGYYNVIAIDHSTSLNCSSAMDGGATIIVDSLPGIQTVIGGGSYCTGSTGLHVGLGFSVGGINYQLYNGLTAVGSAMPGSNSALDFGVKYASGAYWVTATNASTTCKDTMSGIQNIYIDSLPAQYAVTGGGSYCTGGAGVAVGLANSNTGISYQLYNGTTMVGSAMGGTGTAISFGPQSMGGNYTVVATNTITTCKNNMLGSEPISINPLPSMHNVTGGGDFCAGATGVHVGLNGSTSGISYQLSNGGTIVDTKPGTGSALDFGVYTTGGNYTIYATNVTTLCAGNMNGSANVVVNPVPSVYNVTGGGSYCSGGTGVHIGLNGSNTGLSYQLYNGMSPMGSPVTGVTGSALDFGLEMIAGNYTAVATNAITGCSSNMAGSKSININNLPAVYTVTGGGSLCAGSTGVPVGLSGSVSGVSYALMNGTSEVGSMMGTGGALNFGMQTMAGTYDVVATNSSSCTNNMTGSVPVVVNPLPPVYDVTGGGSYCSGASGVHIGLIGSGYGINYQLMRGVSAVGLPVGGTGGALDMGLQTVGGTYYVSAMNVLTGCSAQMPGSAMISVIPTVAPAVSISSSLGNTVCEGTTSIFTATATNGGSAPAYLWTVGGVVEGSGATFAYVPSNDDVIACQLTSNATCATPATSSSSMTMSVMNYVLPSAAVTTTPGNNVCPGTQVSFAGSTVNGGTNPFTTWIINRAYSGTSGTSYSYVPANGDVITMMLVSDQKCRSTDTVYSEPVVITVDSAVAPIFTLKSFLGPVISVGQSDTIRAIVTNGGIATLNYQWFVDGNLVHNNNTDRLVLDTAFNNDTITCIVSSVSQCGSSSATKGWRINLINLGVTTVTGTDDVKVMPNPNGGEFTVTGTLGNLTGKVTLEVTNMLGQVVYTNDVNTTNGSLNEKIKLNSELANGMYLLNVRSGSVNSVYHFVVEK